MQNIGRVNVLQTPQHLVEEIADVIIAQALGLQKFVEVCLHETLDDINIFHGVMTR